MTNTIPMTDAAGLLVDVLISYRDTPWEGRTVGWQGEVLMGRGRAARVVVLANGCDSREDAAEMSREYLRTHDLRDEAKALRAGR